MRASSERKVKKVGCSWEGRIGRVATGSWPCGISVGVAGWRGVRRLRAFDAVRGR